MNSEALRLALRPKSVMHDMSVSLHWTDLGDVLHL